MFTEGAGSLNDSMSGGMQLLPDPLYSLPTDNTYILAITSTDNGRIFLAGKDGCLYEVAYQVTVGFTHRLFSLFHCCGISAVVALKHVRFAVSVLL